MQSVQESYWTKEMTRKLKDESTVEELVEAREYRIKTRCPHKWLLLDLETGERYRPYMTEGTLDWERVQNEDI